MRALALLFALAGPAAADTAATVALFRSACLDGRGAAAPGLTNPRVFDDYMPGVLGLRREHVVLDGPDRAGAFLNLDADGGAHCQVVGAGSATEARRLLAGILRGGRPLGGAAAGTLFEAGDFWHLPDRGALLRIGCIEPIPFPGAPVAAVLRLDLFEFPSPLMRTEAPEMAEILERLLEEEAPAGSFACTKDAA